MRAINFLRRQNLNNISILFIAFIIFLNPYFAGSLSIISGQILVLLFLAIYFFKKIIIEKYDFNINLKFLIIASSIFIYPHIVSFITEANLDFGLIKMQISIFAMIIFGFSIATEFSKNYQQNIIALFLCNIFTIIIFINSVIILLEFYIPELRVFIESFLIPDGKVDYANGLRFRGLASAGGASLSVAHGISISFLYYLYKQNSIGPLRFLIIGTITFISLIFIGRTGFVVAFVGFFYIALFFKSKSKKVSLYVRLWIYIVATVAIFLISYVGVFFNSLPEAYQNYSINLFLGGAESLKSEGTIAAMGSFYNFTDNFYKIFFGTGNFSGGYDYGYDWPADPGIMKILTAYGIFGILFYPLLLMFLTFSSKGKLRDLLIICGTLLVFVEIKEPFIFKGYTSRFFWLLIGLLIFETRLLKFKKATDSV